MNSQTDNSSRIPLISWQLQSSELVSAAGTIVSRPDFNAGSWYPAQIPITVLAALVAAGEYPDPYFGTHLKEIAPQRFAAPWWFRTQFDLAAPQLTQAVLLEFDGINYAADLWLNGQQIGQAREIRGAYRRFQFDVTRQVHAGTNILAVKVAGPRGGDFSTGFVDWNPPPPDGNMGLFRPVILRLCGNVSIENPFVHAQVDLTMLEQAHLTITAELINRTQSEVRGVLSARIETISVEQDVHLAPGQRQEITLTPQSYPALAIHHPRLWWPHDLGQPDLYELDLGFSSAGTCCDKCHVTFGIRQVEDYCNSQGHRGYRINGKDVLIKAAGWTDDLLLADTSDRLETQIRYVKHMNLNAIRLEGIWGCDQTLYDLCDRHGVLMMVGWSCHWEHEQYLGGRVDERYGGVTKPDDIDLISRSWTDQVLWLRNHPSIFVWTVASDKVPHPALEQKYVETFRRYDPGRPYLASTGGVGSEQAIIGSELVVSDVSGPTGVKMLGPYEYTPPVYWYEDTQRGGAYGFNTETCPGAVVPVWESLQRMIPAEHLWPMDDVWSFHCGLNAFSSLDRFREALENRYGPVDDPARFADQAQVLNYELARPMFEAFRVHKGRATGVVQWMLNAAWPKLYWQLYDWFLVPTGAFYATRKACAPLQLIYDYARRSIHLVNDSVQRFEGLSAEILVLDLSGRQIFRNNISVNAPQQSSQMLRELPPLPDITATCFLCLRLAQADTEIASNTYWLSTTVDLLDYGAKVEPWEYYTPSRQYADYRALHTLPPAQIEMNAKSDQHHDHNRLVVTLTNTGSSVAFFVEVVAVNQETDRRVVPIFWSDNYLTLLPGDLCTVETIVDHPLDRVKLLIQGWNIPSQTLSLS